MCDVCVACVFVRVVCVCVPCVCVYVRVGDVVVEKFVHG